MKIIILGAGQVGSSLVASLADAKTDLTLIDQNAKQLALLQNKYDIRTLKGWASHPEVLRQAGCEDADLLIAVTNSDEVNLLACQLADKLFNTPTKIARVGSAAYLARKELFQAENFFSLDYIFSPEQLVAKQLIPLIEYPGVMQLLNLAENTLHLAEVKVSPASPLINQSFSQLANLANCQLVAVYRRNHLVALENKPSHSFKADDEVYFLTQRQQLPQLISQFKPPVEASHKLVIAGGGNIGAQLAASLEQHHRIKIIEDNPQRCKELAEKLERSLIINGSATDKSLLQEESLNQADIFCALTNSDEVNLLSSLLAKHLGAAKVITLVSNPAYLQLIASSAIDVVISPQEITLNSLLSYLRQGHVKAGHSLRFGQALLVEIQARGDANNSKLVGKQAKQLTWPLGVNYLGLVSKKQFYPAKDDVLVADEDRLVFFLTQQEQLTKLEKLFDVGLGFF